MCLIPMLLDIPGRAMEVGILVFCGERGKGAGLGGAEGEGYNRDVK